MTYIVLAVSVLLIGLDQLTKWLAVTYLEPVGSVSLIKLGETEILNLTYSTNDGAAFSILEGRQLFLIIFTAVVILVMLFMLLTGRIKSNPTRWSIGLIIAGGLGNLIDRIVNNYVVDFIDVRFIHFAIFNVADMCAVIGAILLFIFVLVTEIKDSKAKKRRQAEISEQETNAEIPGNNVNE